MNNSIFFKAILIVALASYFTNISAQQTELNHNSDTGANGAQLLLLETGDSGSGAIDDGWTRMWFKNSADPVNRWGFLARPHAGATDRDALLPEPLVMAYTGVQKFGFGSDGTLRINKEFTLPNIDGNANQVMTTDGNGVVTWEDLPSLPNSFTYVINAQDFNAGTKTSDYINHSSGYSYFSSSASFPRLRYSLPVPVGATLTKVTVLYRDESVDKKLNFRVAKDKTVAGSPNSIFNSISTSLFSVDSPNYEELVLNGTSALVFTLGAGEAFVLDLFCTLEGSTAQTSWPGSSLRISKVIVEYNTT